MHRIDKLDVVKVHGNPIKSPAVLQGIPKELPHGVHFGGNCPLQ